jgi:hypothetical protein
MVPACTYSEEETMGASRWTGLVIGAVLASTALAPTGAVAGEKDTNNVIVDKTNRTAQGDLGDARSSSNSHAFIGCYADVDKSGSTYVTSGGCDAQDANSVYVTCLFPSAAGTAFAQMVAAIGNQSFIDFVYDSSGTCIYLEVDNYSFNRPSSP